MSEFPGARDRFVDESRVFVDQNTHSAIVCHGTGGSPTQTADQLGDFFETTPAMTSVHYGIDRAGNIDQYVLEKDGAGGNCCLTEGHDSFWDQFGGDNLNIHTLSFETENDSANSLPLTDPQKQTVFKLIKYWVDKYNIPLSNIKSHASLDPISRARCPGPAFPWQELFAYLNSGQEESMIDLTNPDVAHYFVAAPGGAWHCPTTNATIGGAILAFYQSFGGGLCGVEHLGLPTTSEIGGIPGLPGVILQRFECGVLVYDPNGINDKRPGGSGPVYLAHIDKGIGQDPRVGDLQGQVTALRSQLAALQPDALMQENTALKAKIIQAVKDLS